VEPGVLTPGGRADRDKVGVRSAGKPPRAGCRRILHGDANIWNQGRKLPATSPCGVLPRRTPKRSRPRRGGAPLPKAAQPRVSGRGCEPPGAVHAEPAPPWFPALAHVETSGLGVGPAYLFKVRVSSTRSDGARGEALRMWANRIGARRAAPASGGAAGPTPDRRIRCGPEGALREAARPRTPLAARARPSTAREKTGRARAIQQFRVPGASESGELGRNRASSVGIGRGTSGATGELVRNRASWVGNGRARSEPGEALRKRASWVGSGRAGSESAELGRSRACSCGRWQSASELEELGRNRTS
jgi:hypothetical protein